MGLCSTEEELDQTQAIFSLRGKKEDKFLNNSSETHEPTNRNHGRYLSPITVF
jgi:hypothetical protein